MIEPREQLGLEWLPSCWSCEYADEGMSPADSPRDEEPWQLCRRYAPRVLAEADDGFAGGPAVFPRVTKHDWCGEWVSKSHLAGEPKHRSFLTNELAVQRALDADERGL